LLTLFFSFCFLFLSLSPPPAFPQVTHFHLDHSAALPYFLAKTTFRGRVFMTHPTRAIYKMILTDFVKVSNIAVEEMLYDEQDLQNSMEKIEPINYHQEVEVSGIRFWAYNAGWVLVSLQKKNTFWKFSSSSSFSSPVAPKSQISNESLTRPFPVPPSPSELTKPRSRRGDVHGGNRGRALALHGRLLARRGPAPDGGGGAARLARYPRSVFFWFLFFFPSLFLTFFFFFFFFFIKCARRRTVSRSTSRARSASPGSRALSKTLCSAAGGVSFPVNKNAQTETNKCWHSFFSSSSFMNTKTVFALGRAQELLLILDEHWAANPQLHSIPIFYASALAKRCMAGKCFHTLFSRAIRNKSRMFKSDPLVLFPPSFFWLQNKVYQTYVNMMNEKIRRQIAVENPFVFKHISNLKSMQHFEDAGPCVVMASPGMLQR
jgi:Beta-Casp domain